MQRTIVSNCKRNYFNLNKMKKRYKATVYIIQNNVPGKRVLFTGCFWFMWYAKIALFFETVDYAQLEANGVISFEREIVAL